MDYAVNKMVEAVVSRTTSIAVQAEVLTERSELIACPDCLQEHNLKQTIAKI